MDADIYDETFVQNNLYNPNIETEQIKTVNGIDQLLGDFCLDSNKKLMLTGTCNLFFDPSVKASRCKPTLKKKSISKLAQIFE